MLLITLLVRGLSAPDYIIEKALLSKKTGDFASQLEGVAHLTTQSLVEELVALICRQVHEK